MNVNQIEPHQGALRPDRPGLRQSNGARAAGKWQQAGPDASI